MGKEVQYPGAEISAFADRLKLIVPPQCLRVCPFPESFINHAIRRLYETKDPDARQETMAEIENQANANFTRPNGDTCSGPKIAYFAELRLFPNPEEVACQNVEIQAEVSRPVGTSPDLLDTDAYA